MGLVVVHQYTKYDSAKDKQVLSTRMATLKAITETEGLVLVEGSDVNIDSALLESDGFTAENFKP